MNSIKKEILSDIRNARESIKVAIAWLNDLDYIDILQHKVQMNPKVTIEIVLSNHIDNKDENLKKRIIDLMKAGIKIVTFGSESPQLGNFMHCKFYIIDDSFCKSGSFNWTKAAEKNIECLDIVDIQPKLLLFRRLISNGIIYTFIRNQ